MGGWKSLTAYKLFLEIESLCKRLTFPFPFVHHQSHDLISGIDGERKGKTQWMIVDFQGINFIGQQSYDHKTIDDQDSKCYRYYYRIFWNLGNLSLVNSRVFKPFNRVLPSLRYGWPLLMIERLVSECQRPSDKAEIIVVAMSRVVLSLWTPLRHSLWLRIFPVEISLGKEKSISCIRVAKNHLIICGFLVGLHS